MSKPANPVTLPLVDYSPKHFLLGVTDGVATVMLFADLAAALPRSC